MSGGAQGEPAAVPHGRPAVAAGRTPARRPFVALAAAWCWVVLGAALGAGCRPSSGDGELEVGETATRPRLVLAVVVDGLGWRALQELLPHLDADGVLRRAMVEGTAHPVRLEYAGTFTAPGHAGLYTGTVPRIHGVMANEVWEPVEGRVFSVVRDAQATLWGRDEPGASPQVLRVPTVADELERVTAGAARTVSLSWKDRAAVLPGGRHPDLVLWYEDALPGFTSATWYAPDRPAWLDAWEAAHPLDELLEPWRPLAGERWGRLRGPDAAPGEGGWLGLGAAFPHDPRAAERPYDALVAMPGSSEHLLALADEAARQVGAGRDEVPDLLLVSLSGPDYVGHAYGPDSWEYLDTLVRLDRALGSFCAALEAAAPLATVLTADHGSPRLPEREAPGPQGTGRLAAAAVQSAAQHAAESRLGPGRWVEIYEPPFLVLSEAARVPRRRAAVLDAVRAAVRGLPGVAGAWTAEELRGGPDGPDTDPLRRLAAASVGWGAPGDLFVVPARGWVADDPERRGGGTSHGSPWEYDREVPLVAWGVGVRASRGDEPLPQAAVAATLSALLGIPPPPCADAPPAPGIQVAR
jgi:hypothetical protein